MILWMSDFLTRWQAMRRRLRWHKRMGAYLATQDQPDGFAQVADRYWAGLARHN